MLSATPFWIFKVKMNLITIPLYERLGGDMTISMLVDTFYARILNDPVLAPYFERTNPNKIAQKQISFMKLAFGGPSFYDHKKIREKHITLTQNGLNDYHVDLFLQHLTDSMEAINISDDLIVEAIDIANTYRDDILNR